MNTGRSGANPSICALHLAQPGQRVPFVEHVLWAAVVVKVLKVVEDVGRACHEHGKIAGVHLADRELVSRVFGRNKSFTALPDKASPDYS